MLAPPECQQLQKRWAAKVQFLDMRPVGTSMTPHTEQPFFANSRMNSLMRFSWLPNAVCGARCKLWQPTRPSERKSCKKNANGIMMYIFVLSGRFTADKSLVLAMLIWNNPKKPCLGTPRHFRTCQAIMWFFINVPTAPVARTSTTVGSWFSNLQPFAPQREPWHNR